MIQPIMHDPLFLARKSVPATKDDAGIARDLLDTLMAHREGCVGMAANMIGKSVRIIAFADGAGYAVMYNPEIIKAEEPYETEEGCLSLPGVRKTTRYQTIRVRFQDTQWRMLTKTYKGWTAQIIQHEVDHLNGVLI